MITLNQHTNKMCVNWYDQDGGKKDEIVKVKRAHGREEKEHSLKVYSLMSRSEEWKKKKGGKKGQTRQNTVEINAGVKVGGGFETLLCGPQR